MEALDILEKRIDTLTRILGPVESEIAGETTNKEGDTIVDSLLTAQKMLDGALKDREIINQTVERAPELEKYLDPDYLDENKKIRSKEVFLNAIAPELHAQFEQLQQIKNLEPTLGAEYFRNIPGECTDKLKQIATDNTEFAQQSELIEESLILAMKRYGEIQAGIFQKLDEMKKRLEVVEEKMESKKRSEREKSMPIAEDEPPAATATTAAAKKQ